ncbi:hypothetical protein ACFL5Q_07640, partial [Planctomycetota bacterium]
ESTATSTRAVAFAGAALARAGEEAAAESSAGGSGVDSVPLPHLTITPAEGVIERSLGKWGENLMANVPPEEWGKHVEEHIRSMVIAGHPLSEEVATKLRT